MRTSVAKPVRAICVVCQGSGSAVTSASKYLAGTHELLEIVKRQRLSLVSFRLQHGTSPPLLDCEEIRREPGVCCCHQTEVSFGCRIRLVRSLTDRLGTRSGDKGRKILYDSAMSKA